MSSLVRSGTDETETVLQDSRERISLILKVNGLLRFEV